MQLLTALQANIKMCAEFQNPFSIGTTMSAHNLLQEQLLSDHTLIDAGNGKTISVDRSPAFLDVTTAGVETRVLNAAPRAGLLLTVALNVDGGNLTVTQAGSGAFNQAGNTTLTLADAGDVVQLVSVQIGSSILWRIVGNDGVALS